MTERSNKKTLSLSWDLPHSPEKVWRALTESDLLAQWLMKNDMKPTIGRDFTFKQEPKPWWDGIVYCEVLEIEPTKRIQYSWRSDRTDAGTYRLDTVLTWTLTPIPKGTHLALEQTGFDADTTGAFVGAQKGWSQYVGGLGTFLDHLV